MATTQRKTSTIRKPSTIKLHKKNINQASAAIVKDSKKLARAVQAQGEKKVKEVQDKVLHYSDDLVVQIQKNPLKSVLIATGAGFILSLLLRK